MSATIPLEASPLPTRREFCAYACQAVSVLSAATFAACSGSPTSPSSSAPQLGSVPGTVNGHTISVTMDSGSLLATVGAAAIVQTSLGSFLLSRTGADSFSALTAICTHQQCTITGFSGSQYVCPCHGSRYTTSGGVVNGPAPRALQQFPTQFVDGVLTITV